MIRTILLATALAAASGSAASAATIDFDSAPSSFTSYTEAGATITAGGQSISVLNGPNDTNSILAEGSPRNVFRADFAGLAGFVSVDLGDFNADPDEIFLEAYSAANVLLGSTTLLLDASDTSNHTLSLGLAGVSYVLFGGRDPSLNGNSILADNLSFRLDAAVPEPASWAMMIAGFGLAGAAMRRRSHSVTFA